MKNNIFKLIILCGSILFGDKIFSQENNDYPVNWTALVGVDTINNGLDLVKNCNHSWNNSGAISTNKLISFTNGSFSHIVNDLTSKYLIGLSTYNTTPNYTKTDYAFYKYKQYIYIIEKGRVKARCGKISLEDKLSITRIGNKIIYKKNNHILKKSWTNSSFNLYVDVSIYTLNAHVSNVTASFLPPIKIRTIKTPDNCSSSQNGSASISITGGLAPYSILWSDGNTGFYRDDLLAGKYNFTITDALGNQKSKNI